MSPSATTRSALWVSIREPQRPIAAASCWWARAQRILSAEFFERSQHVMLSLPLAVPTPVCDSTH